MYAQRVQLKTTIAGQQVPLNPYTDCVKNVRQQMPLAGSKLLGTTVLYVGPTTDTYSTGVCYTCKATESSSYYWEAVASGGGSGGGGAVPTITINNITPNQDGVVTLYGDDIYVQSPGDGTYQDSFNWWGQSLKQCTIYQSICDLYEYSAYKISLLGGNEFATQNGVINLTISPQDVLIREQYNDWGQLEYRTTLYDALADLNYVKMGTPNYYNTSDTSYTGDSYELDTYYSEDRPGWVFVRITAGEQDGTAVAQIQGDYLCYTHFHAGQIASFSFPVRDYTEWMIFDHGDPASDATYEIFFVPTDYLPY